MEALVEMKRFSPIYFAAPVLLLVTIAFSGCGLTEQSKTGNNSNQPARAATPVPAESVRAPAAPPAQSGPAIASTDGDKPGMRVEVQELKRTSGDTLSLKFAMINDSAEDLSFGYEFTDPDHSVKDFGGIGGVHLIDPVGKKKYLFVRDTENTCLCSQKVTSIKSGSRASLFAKFPAPPPEVQKIGIVIPHFVPMDDVPISQ